MRGPDPLDPASPVSALARAGIKNRRKTRIHERLIISDPG